MLYDSIGMLILEILLYVIAYIIVIPLGIFFIINILVGICKIRNKKNDKKIFYTTMFLAVIFSIILSSNISICLIGSATKVDGEMFNDLKNIINQIIDYKERKTEIIYVETKDIKTYTVVKSGWKTTQRISDGRYINKGYKSEYYYYLDIRNGEYIIPLESNIDQLRIEKLLYSNEYEKQNNTINKIEVYKNTKFVKAINGIDLNSNFEVIQDFVNKNKID